VCPAFQIEKKKIVEESFKNRRFNNDRVVNSSEVITKRFGGDTATNRGRGTFCCTSHFEGRLA